MKKKLLLFPIGLLLLNFLIFSPTNNVRAQEEDSGVILLENLENPGTEVQESDLSSYLKRLFPLVIGFTGLAAILVMIWEGVKYAASGVPGVKGGSKERITQALWGLLLALSAYIVLRQINPDLVKVNFDLPGTSQNTTP